MTKKEFIQEHNLSENQFSGKEKISGSLDLGSRLTAHIKKLDDTKPLSWRKGKYIKVDEILSEVILKRGNIYKIKIAGSKIESYLVKSDTHWAHGPTLKKANEDLHFKVIAEKLKKDPIKKDTVITVQYYRIITGACESGCHAWMNQNGIRTDSMMADELLPLLENTNAYGVQQFKKLVKF